MTKQIFIIFIILTVLMTFTGQVYGIFYGNDSDDAYDTNSPEGARLMGPGMNQLIIEGAGFFLKSQANLLAFLQKVEMSELNGVDYDAFRQTLDITIDRMESAAATYDELIAAAKETPYNWYVIAQLRWFPYNWYQRRHGLHGFAFSRVKEFLRAGDVTGAYIKMRSDMESILVRLYAVKEDLDAGNFPDIPQLWRINQAYAETMLFGMYMAEVFQSLW